MLSGVCVCVAFAGRLQPRIHCAFLRGRFEIPGPSTCPDIRLKAISGPVLDFAVSGPVLDFVSVMCIPFEYTRIRVN